MKRYPQRFLLILIVLFQAIAGIAGGIGAAGHYYENRIIPGLEINQIPLDGLTYEEAKSTLYREAVPPSAITLIWGEETFSLPLFPGLSTFQVDGAIENALEMGRLSRSNHYFFNTMRWVPLSISLGVPLTISDFYLQNALQRLKSEIDREPLDARLAIGDGIPSVIEEQSGWFLDLDKSRESIENHLLAGCFEEIPLIVKEKLPHIKQADLPVFDHLIASCSTPLGDSCDDRKHNIMLAKEAINGRVIGPGEIFSFNDTVGPVTAEQGYREALVIQNRQFVLGMGGGICQAATTLYGVALQGEMGIVQRSPHSRPVSYVPLGQDATVAQGLIDFQFRNSYDFPVLLTGRMDSCLTFCLYGAERETGRSVEIVTEDIEVLFPYQLEQPDPSLPKGVRNLVRRGEEGYMVNVYRLIRVGKEEIAKEFISTDLYMPINEVLRVGTKEIAKVKK